MSGHAENQILETIPEKSSGNTEPHAMPGEFFFSEIAIKNTLKSILYQDNFMGLNNRYRHLIPFYFVYLVY